MVEQKNETYREFIENSSLGCIERFKSGALMTALNLLCVALLNEDSVKAKNCLDWNSVFEANFGSYPNQVGNIRELHTQRDESPKAFFEQLALTNLHYENFSKEERRQALVSSIIDSTSRYLYVYSVSHSLNELLALWVKDTDTIGFFDQNLLSDFPFMFAKSNAPYGGKRVLTNTNSNALAELFYLLAQKKILLTETTGASIEQFFMKSPSSLVCVAAKDDCATDDPNSVARIIAQSLLWVKGKLAFVVPEWFRHAYQLGDLRRKMVMSRRLSAVIDLPAGMTYKATASSDPVCVFLFDEENAFNKEVRFISMLDEKLWDAPFSKDRKRELSQEGIALRKLILTGKSAPAYIRPISMRTISSNQCSLWERDYR